MTKLAAYPDFKSDFATKMISKLLTLLGDLYCVLPALEIIGNSYILPTYAQKE